MNDDDLIDLIFSDGSDHPEEWKKANGIESQRPVIREKQKQTHINFTAEERNFLKKNLQILGVEECARRMGRSENSIRVQAGRYGYIRPRHAEGYLSGRVIADILGVDSHYPPCWIDKGIIHGEAMPYPDTSPLKRWVKVIDFKKWIIRPESWVFFKIERMTNPYYKKLVMLAQGRWGDEWLDIPAAGKIWETDAKCALCYIKNHHIPAMRVPGMGRMREQTWALWYIRRSVVESTRYAKKGSPAAEGFWTEAGEKFLLKARDELGLHFEDIVRMMKAPIEHESCRIHYLMLKKKLGESPKKFHRGKGKNNRRWTKERQEYLLEERNIHHKNWPEIAAGLDIQIKPEAVCQKYYELMKARGEKPVKISLRKAVHKSLKARMMEEKELLAAEIVKQAVAKEKIWEEKEKYRTENEELKKDIWEILRACNNFGGNALCVGKENTPEFMEEVWEPQMKWFEKVIDGFCKKYP